MPRMLTEIAKDVRRIVLDAVQDLGKDLQGNSVIDLVMDNVEDHISTQDAKVALVIAGVDDYLSRRLVRSYSFYTLPGDTL